MPKSTLGSGLPPLPDPAQKQGPLSISAAPMQQSMAGANGAAAAALQPPPAPSHAQTVASLRHFQAILGQLENLLKNPELGKADVRSDIIEGMTQLVADRFMEPQTAVAQLASVPDKPFDQRKWAQQMFTQTIQAQNAVLDHHRTQTVGTGNYELENMLHESDPDDHINTMKNMLQAHYAPSAGNA